MNPTPNDPRAPRPAPREERSFGLVVGGAFALLGALAAWRGKAFWPYPAALGGTLVLLGLLAPGLLRVPRALWMRLAEAMSFVMTRVILALVFFLAVLPTGLVRRLLGKGSVLRKRPASGSFWVPYPERQRDPKHYERMF